MKHTSGKWSIITRGSRTAYERGIGAFQTSRSTFRPVATIDGDIDNAETEANAALIAEAPVMYEFIAEIAKHFEGEPIGLHAERIIARIEGRED